jgi:hypothetical protein
MSLTRPDVMRGPRFSSTAPVQEPPPLTSFVSPCGPGTVMPSTASVRSSSFMTCVGSAIEAAHQTSAEAPQVALWVVACA